MSHFNMGRIGHCSVEMCPDHRVSSHRSVSCFYVYFQVKYMTKLSAGFAVVLLGYFSQNSLEIYVAQ